MLLCGCVWVCVVACGCVVVVVVVDVMFKKNLKKNEDGKIFFKKKKTISVTFIQ